MTGVPGRLLDISRRLAQKRGDRAGGPALLEFQSDAAEAESRGPVPIAGITLYAAAAAIAGLVLWASLSRVDEIVVGSGKVITSAPKIVVAPLETSVIRSIDVQVGALVHAGDALAHLDPSFAQADVTELRRRDRSLGAEIAREHAELAGEAYRPSVRPDLDEMVQLGIDRDRRAQYNAKIEAYDQRAAQYAADIATRRSEIAVLEQRLMVLQRVEAMRKELATHGNGSKIEALAATDQRLEVQGSIAEDTSEIAAYQHQLDGAAAERRGFIQKWREDIAKDLVAAERDESDVAGQLSKAAHRQQMVVLRTPMDAVVLEIAPRSVGSVMRGAETLMTLVPVRVPMEIEARIPARDIGEVAVGDAVTVKLEAFPYQRYGTLAGKVAVVSRDSFVDGAGAEKARTAIADPQPYYRVRIDLLDRRLAGAPADFHLTPGMTASAEIKVGKRRLITYLLYPFLRGINESFHEP